MLSELANIVPSRLGVSTRQCLEVPIRRDCSTRLAGNYRRCLRLYVLPRWGLLRLGEITAAAVAEWLKHLRQHCAAATVCHHPHEQPPARRPPKLTKHSEGAFLAWRARNAPAVPSAGESQADRPGEQ